jgi:DNA-directed RNA polymerase specialized sigma24 family protein
MRITQEIMDVVESFELNEDAKQDAYVKLLESDQREFANNAHRDNYIRQLVFWTRNNESAKEDNRARLLEENQDLIRDLYNSGTDEFAEDPAAVIEAEERMDNFLEILSDTYRRTFTRLYLDGLTPQDLADEEGVARNAIDQRVHNIKLLVKENFNV